MSPDLVSIGMRYLNPDMIARIASALGVDKTLVGQAVKAAVPALIGSLAGVASKPGGPARLNAVVSEQSPGILDDISEMVEGASQQDLIQTGRDALKSLLGASSLPALAGAIGKYAGLNQSTSFSLLSMLAPAVLGVLGQQKQKQGLDGSGLAKLLSEQKDNVAAAMPPGFRDMLKSAGVPGFEAPAMAAREQVSTAAFAKRHGVEARGRPSVLTWILPIAAAGVAAWWFLSDRNQTVSETPPTETRAVETDIAKKAAEPANLIVGEVDLGRSWDKTFGELRQTLEGVTDVATARSALPSLQAATSELEKLADLSRKLPAEARTALAAKVAEVQPQLDDLCNKVLSIPGVAEFAKPRIETVRTHWNNLAQA